MSENLGVYAKREAAKVFSPNVAKVSIPYFVGTAPVHMVAKAAKAGAPVLCNSWDEAVDKLGFSEDWEKYTLCEAMYSHFQFYGCRPAVFCNVLDTAKAAMVEAVEGAVHQVKDHRVVLDAGMTRDGLTVKSGENTLVEGVDYLALYTKDGSLVLELLEDGGSYEAMTLHIDGKKVKPEGVTDGDIAEGVGKVDLCMTTIGVVPDLIVAPGWSGDNVVAAVMAAKAESICGLFKGKALIDIPAKEGGVTECDQLSGYKSANGLTDFRQFPCWPMVTMGGLKFHLSTHMAGLMATVDVGNNGIPYESPSNKGLKIDGTILADGTSVELTWPQVDMIAGDWGVVTAVNFMDMGWVLKGNYTAAFPGNGEVDKQFIPVSRMMDFIGNTAIRTFWPKLDKPMNIPLVRSIAETLNGWLDALWAGGYLNGARVELLADENALAELMKGHIVFHVYDAAPVPAQRILFKQEYDVSYASSAINI